VLGVALSEKFREALSEDPVEGLNVRVTVQVPVTAGTGMLGTHVVEVIVKSAANVPVMPGLLVNTTAAVPVLARFTICCELVVPSLTEPKETLEGTSTIGVPLGVPVPVKLTLCRVGVALSEKVSDAPSAVLNDGRNVTVTVQLPPAATGVPTLHVVTVIVKSELFAPVIPGVLVRSSNAVPVFISVAVFGGLVTPCMTDPNARLGG
jgi:hypothetical protein